MSGLYWEKYSWDLNSKEARSIAMVLVSIWNTGETYEANCIQLFHRG